MNRARFTEVQSNRNLHKMTPQHLMVTLKVLKLCINNTSADCLWETTLCPSDEQWTDIRLKVRSVLLWCSGLSPHTQMVPGSCPSMFMSTYMLWSACRKGLCDTGCDKQWGSETGGDLVRFTPQFLSNCGLNSLLDQDTFFSVFCFSIWKICSTKCEKAAYKAEQWALQTAWTFYQTCSPT